ncbi:unannotated protein [freshwater metagenome]|uniref:Unannotated protein n=1 Tax=freshwater metagenome TaxID=449393 RepID=A0A6J7DHP3_9ZZZZ
MLRPLLPGVELTPRLVAPARHDDRADMLRLEDPKRRIDEVRGEVDKLEVEAQVRLVAAESAHGLGVGHLRNLADLDVEDPLPEGADDGLAHLDHVGLLDEGHLDVELGELRLTIRAEVLVAVAPGNLEVPLHAGHHEQLLEELRRLGQRIPVARLQAYRHQEVARTFRGRSGEGRRLDLDEIALEQHVSGDLVHLGAHAQGIARRLPTQVEVAVPEADLVADRDSIVDGERQRCGHRENLDLGRHHLDRTGRQFGVLVAGRPGRDCPNDAQAVLVAQAVSDLGVVNDHLDDAARIAQVEEGDAPMVSSARHPPGEGYRAPGID